MLGSTLPLFRLLQITDSSFPVGGYAYSHGLEWLVSTEQGTDEADLEQVVRALILQTVRRQWLPAAARAHRASRLPTVAAADEALDASISAVAEREAGRAMGRRLLDVLAEVGTEGAAEELRAMVRGGASPGQFAVAFAVAARDAGASEADTLAALAYSLVNSVPQAGIRLGVIGPSAAARIVASSSMYVDEAVRSVVAESRPSIGAFAPMLELAAMLQPTLRFRMFAS